MTTQSKSIKQCQICESNSLESVLFLGYMPPVNTMPDITKEPEEERAFPLELLRCKHCSLVQIGTEVEQNVLFPPEYPYLSGSTGILKKNFADLYNESSQIVGLETNDLVIDIGSNDGTLLSNFHHAGHRVLGVEPTLASEVAKKNGINTMMAFFNMNTAGEIARTEGKAKIITAANVFAHINDIHKIVEAIEVLLDDKGVFISENHYLLDLVNELQYDTVYHEHLRYYSVESVKKLLEAHGLEVFYVKPIPSHGGSIRIYAARKGDYRVNQRVHDQIAKEHAAGLHDGTGLQAFRSKVIQSKLDLLALLATLKKDNATVYGIGAPSRASTLVNYVGLDDGLMDAVMEISSSHKLNKFMPGTRVPVLDEKQLYEQQPDYALLLSWHIADELIPKLKEKGYRGKFIVPLPEPTIV